MTEATWLDVILAGVLLTAAAAALITRNRRAAVAAFLVFGSLLTLVWLRLGSVDVAFAEAALGTGMLSALLVWLVARPTTEGERRSGAGTTTSQRWLVAGLAVAGGATITLAVAGTLLRTASQLPAWQELLSQSMPVRGVEHDVTAVLLVFRGYDTLLESFVLLLAAVAVASLGTGIDRTGTIVQSGRRHELLAWVVRVLAPVLALLGLWFLFAGSSSPGGAFQSGALWAGMLILLNIGGVDLRPLHRRLLLPATVIGVLVFAVAGMLGPLLGDAWLTWPEPAGFAVILGVEIALTVSIAAGLYLLFISLANPPRTVKGAGAGDSASAGGAAVAETADTRGGRT